LHLLREKPLIFSMKQTSLLFVLFIFTLGCNIDLHQQANPHKEFANPPNCVWLRNNIYIDKTEISNGNWLEYLNWLKVNHKEEHYLKSLPDTLVWRHKYTHNEPFVESYLRHPAYFDYPIIGITYEQAVDFCKWRTDRVMENYVKNRSKLRNSFRSVKYRLPTKEEWLSVSKVFSRKPMLGNCFEPRTMIDPHSGLPAIVSTKTQIIAIFNLSFCTVIAHFL
jgi:Sulfatase-modifying factor enzyme 1